MAGPNDDLLAQYGLGGLIGGDEEEDVKPVTTAGKINITQDFAKLLADTRGGGPEATAFALSFLGENPDLTSQLYTNYDIASAEGTDKFTKMMLELERIAPMGQKLGNKSTTLSNSVTTRTLSPSEAESIFNLELKFQQLAKQAPLEAAKFLAPGFTPELFRGSHMPGFEEGGVYRNALPGMNPKMFEYQPTPPGAIDTIARMFTPDENESMQMARMAMQNALKTGISSTSTTSGSSTTTGSGGGGGMQGMSPNALVQAWMAMQQGQNAMPGSPMSNVQLPDAGNAYPEAAPMGSTMPLPSMGPPVQSWSSQQSSNPLEALFGQLFRRR